MDGFKNTTKMLRVHDMSRAGQTVGHVPSFARGGSVRRFAQGGAVRDKVDEGHVKPMHDEDGQIGGLDESFEHEAKEKAGGNALVQRSNPQVSEELEAGGGRSPLRPGYAKGGKPEKHFHVHNHYHNGKRLPSKGKLKKMEMQKQHATGGTIDKVAKGGKIHIKKENKGKLHRELGVKQSEKIPVSKLKKAEHSANPAERKRAQFADNARKFHHADGGHIHDDTHEIPPDYATGGTINPMNAGGVAYGGMATGGTINELGVGGMPQRPVMAGGPPQGALGALAARGRPMPGRPMPRPGAMPGGQAMPMQRPGTMPVQGARPMMQARGGSIARSTGGRSGRGGC
jgi:hypothetical protein